MEDEDRNRTGTSSEASDDSTPRLGRRRLLRTGINVGAAGALVWGVGADYVSSNRLGRISYAMARPEPDASTLEPRTKSVPVPWHESLRLAFGVQERVRDAGFSPLLGSFVIPGSYDEPEASITVDATDEGIAETLKEVAEDVAVNVNVVDQLPPRSGGDTSISEAVQIADPDVDTLPGGVVCEGTAGFGTLAPAVFDHRSGERFFATSNHLFNDSGSKVTEHRGEALSILHDDERYRIGTVERGYPLADLVRVDPDHGYRPATTIDRASPSRVIGQYTKLGLADLMARGETLTKVGALSNLTRGAIKGVDGVTCYTGTVCKPGQLKWGDETSLVDGDSGSVNFHPDPEHPDDYILIGGTNNARTWWPGADFTWGTGAHHLYDEHGLHF